MLPSILEKLLRRLKKKYPALEKERLEKELIPLKPGEELQPRIKKKEEES